ncbi:MAG TPA: hypothetical protein VF786_15455, partial [Terriglobales bacterium]
NALPTLKERADLVMEGARGAGVEQLIAEMLEDDLARYDSQITRHSVLLGSAADVPPGKSQQVCIAPYRGSLLFAGPSGSGKSTAATGVIERVGEQGYQFCIIDPEGDYEDFPGAIVLGTATDAPNPSEVLKALEQPKDNVVVNLLGVPLEDRPLFFASLLPRIFELRARTARPHWIVVDETHHLLPSSWTPAPATLPQSLGGLMMITVHPDWISPAALAEVEVVIAVGKQVRETLANFCRVLNEAPPHISRADLESGTAAVWFRRQHREPVIVKVEPGKVDRKRHVRKYAEGELPPDRSFYFRGPQNRLKLRAQNLNMFLQLADGVDDESWMFHLERGDYSDWLREFIKDPELADEVREIEQRRESAEQSRKNIRAAIERRYTAAA